MRPECENLRPRRKILFGKIPACPRREMQRHHTPATCWLRFGAATIILSVQSIVNVGTRLIGWKFCRKAHSFRLRSTPRTHSRSVASPEYPISTPFPRKNHTPAVPLRQLQSPLAPVAWQVRIREIRKRPLRESSSRANVYIGCAVAPLTPRAADTRVWITLDRKCLHKEKGGPQQWSRSQRWPGGLQY